MAHIAFFPLNRSGAWEWHYWIAVFSPGTGLSILRVSSYLILLQLHELGITVILQLSKLRFQEVNNFFKVTQLLRGRARSNIQANPTPSLELYIIHQWFLKCGPKTSSSSIFWKLVTNTNYWVPWWKYWIRNLVVERVGRTQCCVFSPTFWIILMLKFEKHMSSIKATWLTFINNSYSKGSITI